MSDISVYLEKQKELERIGAEIADEITNEINEIKKIRIKGVRNLAPNICIVQFRNLKRGNLQAEHYLFDAQAKAILKFLEPCGKNPLKILERLEKIYTMKKIKRSPMTGDVIFIHEDFLAGIKKIIKKYKAAADET